MTDRTGDGTPQPTISLSTMLKQVVVDADDKPLGRLDDVVVLMRGQDQYPVLTGLIVEIGETRVFVPVSNLVQLDADPIRHRPQPLLPRADRPHRA